MNTGVWLTSTASRNTITTGGWTIVRDDQTDPTSMNHISRAGASAIGPNGGATFLQGLTAGGLSIAKLANPTAQPTVTPTGGAAGSYTYTTVAVSPYGGTTAAGPTRTITNGPTTLDGTHYNTIQVAMVYGASAIDVYRTAGGTTQGKIASIPVYISRDGDAVSSRFQVVDNGLAGDSATAPSTNTTGQVSSSGKPAGCVQYPCVVASGVATGLNATINNTNCPTGSVADGTLCRMFTSSTSGEYLVTGNVYVTAAGSSGTLSVSFTWPANNGPSGTSSSNINLTTLHVDGQALRSITLEAGEKLFLNTTLTCSSCGSPTYTLRWSVTQLTAQ